MTTAKPTVSGKLFHTLTTLQAKKLTLVLKLCVYRQYFVISKHPIRPTPFVPTFENVLLSSFHNNNNNNNNNN